MTQTQLTAILSAFYRHGRRGFVPLTAEELDRAANTHSNTRSSLSQQGYLRSYGQKHNLCYELTEAGKLVVQKHLTRRK
jgi:hypothetical protein